MLEKERINLLKRLFNLFIYNRKYVPDKLYIKWRYYIQMEKKLNLNNPLTFNEKIQWLKLYDRNPLYTLLADKYEAKKYVERKIGIEYTIPLLGIWSDFESIDFEKLPERFVLKCTHDSGGIVICKNKDNFDLQEARKIINRSLKTNYYYYGREWPYKNITPRIIAEAYMKDEDKDELTDYKFFCFDGIPKIMFVATDRTVENEETKFDFFDMEFNNLHIVNGHPNSKNEIKRPKSFEKMKELAVELSRGMPHVRVDFYEIEGTPYFGEFTFYSHSGVIPFEPDKWDRIIGDWLTLPMDSQIQ